MSSSANKIEITQSTLLKLLIRRGSDAERENITLSEGELGYTVDTLRLFVGDGATVGGNPVSLFLFSSSSAPTVHTSAVLNDLAYDSTEGKLYKLTGSDPTVLGNWTEFLTSVRVDNRTTQLSTFNGVPNTIMVKTVSAAQLDAGLAGLGIEFSGKTLQTKAAQTFDSIDIRTAQSLQLPTKLKFGTGGGASEYSMPSYDGINGYSLTTNGNGVLQWAPGNSVVEYLVLSGNQVPVGTIVQFGSGGSFGSTVSAYQVPYGYLPCDGRTLSVSGDYSALYATISTFYGSVSAGTFKIPSLSATNVLYLIKYLADQYIQTVTVSLENSLTGLNVTTTAVITSFDVPQPTATEFRIGVPDYVSKTYVDAAIAGISPENSVYRLAKLSEPNCSNCSNSVGAVMFIDRRSKAVRFSGLDRSGAAGIGNIQNNCTLTTIESPIEFGDAYETAAEVYGAEGTTLVLTNSGNVYAAGDNQYGINGTGNAQSGGISTANSKYTKITFPAGTDKIVKISIGGGLGSGGYSSKHAFALTETGSAFAWGYNLYGQTGIDSSTNPVITPTSTHTGSLANKLIREIYSFSSNTYGYSFAIDTNGYVHVCGYNGSGNLGNNTITNVVTGWMMLNITADKIYGGTGATNNFALLLSGSKLWGTGWNGASNLGLNYNTPNDYKTTFTPVCADGTTSTQLSGVSALSISDNTGGYSTQIALMNNKTIRTWGYNGTGQCGIGDTSTLVLAPTASMSTSGGFSNSGIIKVKSHGYYSYSTTFVMNTAGQIWATGYNGVGQLGIGAAGVNASSFTKVIQPKSAFYIDFNVYQDLNTSYHTVAAVDSNNKLYCWGSNIASQCGIGNYDSYGYNNITYYGIPMRITFS